MSGSPSINPLSGSASKLPPLVFACAVIAAVVTPTVDVISMLALMVPLYMLYELGILLLTVAPSQAVAEGGVVRNALGTLVGRPKYRPRRTDGAEGDE